jgi:hypothetical protein
MAFELPDMVGQAARFASVLNQQQANQLRAASIAQAEQQFQQSVELRMLGEEIEAIPHMPAGIARTSAIVSVMGKLGASEQAIKGMLSDQESGLKMYQHAWNKYDGTPESAMLLSRALFRRFELGQLEKDQVEFMMNRVDAERQEAGRHALGMAMDDGALVALASDPQSYRKAYGERNANFRNARTTGTRLAIHQDEMSQKYLLPDLREASSLAKAQTLATFGLKPFAGDSFGDLEAALNTQSRTDGDEIAAFYARTQAEALRMLAASRGNTAAGRSTDLLGQNLTQRENARDLMRNGIMRASDDAAAEAQAEESNGGFWQSTKNLLGGLVREAATTADPGEASTGNRAAFMGSVNTAALASELSADAQAFMAPSFTPQVETKSAEDLNSQYKELINSLTDERASLTSQIESSPQGVAGRGSAEDIMTGQVRGQLDLVDTLLEDARRASDYLGRAGQDPVNPRGARTNNTPLNYETIHPDSIKDVMGQYLMIQEGFKRNGQDAAAKKPLRHNRQFTVGWQASMEALERRGVKMRTGPGGVKIPVDPVLYQYLFSALRDPNKARREYVINRNQEQKQGATPSNAGKEAPPPSQ